MTRKFECHITMEYVPEAFRKSIIGHITPHGFRLAKLYKQDHAESRRDTFCTAHSTDLEEMHTRMTNCIAALKAKRVEIYRAKIEEILYDERFQK